MTESAKPSLRGFSRLRSAYRPIRTRPASPIVALLPYARATIGVSAPSPIGPLYELGVTRRNLGGVGPQSLADSPEINTGDTLSIGLSAFASRSSTRRRVARYAVRPIRRFAARPILTLPPRPWHTASNRAPPA